MNEITVFLLLEQMKHETSEGKVFTRTDFEQALRMSVLMLGSILEIRFHKGLSYLQDSAKWVLHRFDEAVKASEEINPMLYQQSVVLGHHQSKVFQSIPLASESHTLAIDISMPALWDASLWNAKQWFKAYQPLDEVWKIKKSRVSYEHILEMSCSAEILAALTNQSANKIKQDRKKFRIDSPLKVRDCGPQIKLIQRSEKRCFLLFLGALWFQYCLALEPSVDKAFYWAVRNVKETGLYIQLQKEKSSKDRFSFENNLYYCLCSLGLLKASKKLLERVKPIEAYPRKLLDYCDAKDTARTPKFSLKGFSFEIPHYAPKSYKDFLVKLNSRLREGKSYRTLIKSYWRGKV